MRIRCLVLFAGAMCSGAQEAPLQATRVAHVLVLDDVWLNGHGPLRMVVDTGAASCLVRPALAARIGLRAAFFVEQETLAGVNEVPAAIVEDLRAGPVRDRAVEVLIAEAALDGVDGILGQSWLVRHDYLLDYRNRRLVLDPAEAPAGVRTALRYSDGRPMVAAEIDGHRCELVVDSGTPVLVLFQPAAPPVRWMLLTNNGVAGAGLRSTRVAIGSKFTRRMQAAEVHASAAPGLLPALEFGAVYISNRDGVVVLVP